ncbi:hypothetical protein N431DRAFT_509225 [Stipitochalara longipes BDJ]|nr:hypothetical protein N431DRAFT_509225 [Stipitochalara longipes BDJ]
MFYRPNSAWSWAMVVATVLEIGTVLALEVAIFIIFQLALRPSLSLHGDLGPDSKIIPTVLVLLIFGFIYLALLLYDTLAKKDTIQLGGISFFAACLLGFTTIQIDQVIKGLTDLSLHGLIAHDDILANIRSMTIVIAVMTGLYTAVTMFLGIKLYSEFQWNVYRLLNADLAMQRRYFTFKAFTTILKFDLFFFSGFIIQLLVVVTGLTPSENALASITIPLIIITLLASTWCTRRENVIGTFVVLILHFALLAIFIFKFVRMYQVSFELKYRPARKGLTYFGSLTIILSLVTIGLAVKCLMNFGNGLKIHINSQRLKLGLLEDEDMELSEFSGQRVPIASTSHGSQNHEGDTIEV